MARKSRKNKNIETIAQINEVVEYEKRIATAIYARLSEKNNSYDNEDSIETQIKLDEEFIASHPEFELVETYIDNGFSGTNFNRPEFTRLMEDVKHGKIQCVVVKDLSRFGRNYLEAGYYIETMFPLLNARLIAVTDGFDSNRLSDRNSFTIPIKNMVNAMFAKDVSRKQIAAGDMRRKYGIYNPPIIPYGYQYSDSEKKLVKVDELKPYVDMIFKWTLLGVSRIDIARRYALMQVPTPASVAQQQGAQVGKNSEGWTEHTVKGILTNPTYAGTIALGRTKQALCYGIAPRNIVRDEWIYFYDMHEAYVSKEDYSKIEESIRATSEHRKKRIEENREARAKFPDVFRGMVYCAECNKPMPYALGGHNRLNTDWSFAYYRCISRKKISKCKNQRVQQNYLKIMVMDQIRNLIRIVCDQKEILKKVKRDELPDNALRRIRRDILTKRRNIKELERKKVSLYEDYAEGILDREEYQYLREQAISDIQRLQDKIVNAEQRLIEMNKAIDHHIEEAESLEEKLECKEFDPALVKALIKTIKIYNDNRIEIVFNCLDVFENVLINDCLHVEV